MSLDINNNYRGTLYGRDRLGYTTPDADASEPLRPFLPVPYPAPWLPGKRLDEGHPVGAQVVLSSHSIVGLDKSGALVPAGLISGTQVSSQILTGTPAATTTVAGAGGVLTLTILNTDVAYSGKETGVPAVTCAGVSTTSFSAG